MKKQIFYMTFIALLSGCNCYKGNILQIEEQGSFAVGGTVLTDSLGHKYHGDHAYVFYQKPVDARKYPLVFAHGVGQFSKTWETTPDGREGFQNIFLRKGFSTYLVDQPVASVIGSDVQLASRSAVMSSNFLSIIIRVIF